jgi:hypothetical protein
MPRPEIPEILPHRRSQSSPEQPSPSGRGDDGLLKAPPTLGTIEERMMLCDYEIEGLIHQHFSVSDAKASAEADWKKHRDRCLLAIASGDKTDPLVASVGKSADLREAYAKKASSDGKTGEELYETFKILESHEASLTLQIKALQSRMNLLMSMAKSIRSETGI